MYVGRQGQISGREQCDSIVRVFLNAAREDALWVWDISCQQCIPCSCLLHQVRFLVRVLPTTSLSNLKSPDLIGHRSSLADFLEKQRLKRSLFNYIVFCI